MRWWLTPLALATLIVAVAACGAESAPLSGEPVLGRIPWTAPERATYRITQGDIEGSGVLSVERQGSRLVFTHDYEGGGFTDSIVVEASAETLQPETVERTIEGDEGPVTCTAAYSSGSVSIRWQSGSEERLAEAAAPSVSYDTWTDLFLWRTLPFSQTYEARYVDVASCARQRSDPEAVEVELRVKGTETVEVPAGTFEAWRLEIKAEGHTQKAWFSTDESATLVVYELESVE